MPWLIAGLVAAAVALFLLLNKNKVQKSRENKNSYSDESDSTNEAQAREQRLRRKAEDIKGILNCGDEQLARMLLSEAGCENRELMSAAKDDELIRKIAQDVDDGVIHVLSCASKANLQIDAINLKASNALEETPYPADVSEVDAMTSDDDIPRVLPEELAMDDDVFYANLQNDELNITRHYKEVQRKKLGYLLFDVSGSMREIMSNYGSRIQWAAGIALRLMMHAINGMADYILRFFGPEPYDMHIVRSPIEAKELASILLHMCDQNVGTNIQVALEQAVDDIKAQKTPDLEASDIVLISDGEDSKLDKDWLASTFIPNGDIRLHVIMIGLENSTLKAYATTYNVYS
jgi:uncharacterized protein with von Willebrand factor type A (vWA) domain